MYDNKIKHNEKTTVHTYEVEGGELLLIAYFPAANLFTIDGTSVTRAQTNEDMDGLTVFIRRSDKKLFTVVTDSLAKLYI